MLSIVRGGPVIPRTLLIALSILVLAGPCLAQSNIAGIAWNDPGFYLIRDNGDMEAVGYMVETVFEWLKPMSLGNFWDASTDSLHVTPRIVGFEFVGFDPQRPDMVYRFPPGTFIVLVDDGRWFTRSVASDSSGFSLIDRVPKEHPEMSLRKW